MNRTTSYTYAKAYFRLASIAIVAFALVVAFAIVRLVVHYDDMENVVFCLVLGAYAALWMIGALGVRRMRTWGVLLVCALALLNLVAIGIVFDRLAVSQRLIVLPFALPYLYMLIEGAILLFRTPNASDLRELQHYSSHPDLAAYVQSVNINGITRALAIGGLERKLAAIDALRAMGPAAASSAPQLSAIVRRSLDAGHGSARFCEVCGKSLSAFSSVGSMCVRCSSELQVLKSINAWGRAPSLSQQAAAALAAIEARAQPVSIELHDASAGKEPRLACAASVPNAQLHVSKHLSILFAYLSISLSPGCTPSSVSPSADSSQRGDRSSPIVGAADESPESGVAKSNDNIAGLKEAGEQSARVVPQLAEATAPPFNANALSSSIAGEQGKIDRETELLRKAPSQLGGLLEAKASVDSSFGSDAAIQSNIDPEPSAEEIVKRGGDHWSATRYMKFRGTEFEINAGERFFLWPVEDRVYTPVDGKLQIKFRWMTRPGQKPPIAMDSGKDAKEDPTVANICFGAKASDGRGGVLTGDVDVIQFEQGATEGEFSASFRVNTVGAASFDGEGEVFASLSPIALIPERAQSNILRLKVKFN